MATDQLVQSKDVLESLMQLRRQGREKVMQQLEQIEPDLAEYVMEELGQIHQQVLHVGVSARQSRKLEGRFESLVLVGLLALRQGLLRFWREEMATGHLRELDRSQDAQAPDQQTDEPPDDDREAFEPDDEHDQ